MIRPFASLSPALAALAVGALALGGLAATAGPAPAQVRQPAEGYGDLAERLMPAVVNIATTQRLGGVGRPPQTRGERGGRFDDLFGDENLNEVSSLGSGFIVSAQGMIVTNNHVIEGADQIEVVFQDGDRLRAEIVGRDPATDIAVLKVNAPQPLPFVRFAAANSFRVGDLVIAIGNPFGLGGSVSAGIVSARNRNISAGRYDDFIQTDAAINRGNSGGPLFNMAGDVIGVNTAIVSPTGGSVGVGFAAPADLVSSVVNQIIQYGETRRGWLGVRIGLVTPDAAQRAGLQRPRGALVTAITPNSPAARAGLQAGDIILKFDGRDILEGRNLTRIVADTPINKTVAVEFARGARRLSANVTVLRLDEGRPPTVLAARPDEGGQPATANRAVEGRVLGLTLSTLTPQLRQRFGIGLDARGLVVVAVDPASDAASKLQPGDVVVEMQFEEVETIAEAQRVVQRAPAARPVLVYVNRGGDMTFRSVKRR
ncbi:MAG: Do family serine endopeptidase [Hyphomonadaceae bacterium]|nr:Do family serine endopeptidase [Hyphomonadaceae bacterium]